MRIFKDIKHRHTIWFKFRDIFFTSLTMLGLKAKASICSAIKVKLSPSKKNYVICSIESSLKIMKNAFYFVLKAFFVLKIFKFLS